MSLALPHRAIAGSVLWRVHQGGVSLEESEETFRTVGPPSTCQRIRDTWAVELDLASSIYAVPIPILVMTAATETRGGPHVVRKEPGYRSDEETPWLVSAGICQTLLSTSREVLQDLTVTVARLQDPQLSFLAAAAYISRDRFRTYMDPVLVAADYNAGSLRSAPYPGNRWRLWCHKPQDGEHLERAVRWYGDAMSVESARP